MMIATIITSLLIESDSYTTILVGIYSLTIVLNSFNVIRNYFTSIVQNEYIVKAEISRTAIGIVLKLVLLFSKVHLQFCNSLYDRLFVTCKWLLHGV